MRAGNPASPIILRGVRYTYWYGNFEEREPPVLGRLNRWQSFIPALLMIGALSGVMVVVTSNLDATPPQFHAAPAVAAYAPAQLGTPSQHADSSLELAGIVATGLALVGLGWRRP